MHIMCQNADSPRNSIAAGHHQHGKWEARIGRVDGNRYLYLGTFASEEDAARAYDLAAIKFRGKKVQTSAFRQCLAHCIVASVLIGRWHVGMQLPASSLHAWQPCSCDLHSVFI